jgi:hypothetical protein
MSSQRKRRPLGVLLIHDTQEDSGNNCNMNKGTNCPVNDLFKTRLDGANRGVHPSLNGVYSGGHLGFLTFSIGPHLLSDGLFLASNLSMSATRF